jgi:hypothetical protein
VREHLGAALPVNTCRRAEVVGVPVREHDRFDVRDVATDCELAVVPSCRRR